MTTASLSSSGLLDPTQDVSLRTCDELGLCLCPQGSVHTENHGALSLKRKTAKQEQDAPQDEPLPTWFNLPPETRLSLALVNQSPGAQSITDSLTGEEGASCSHF